MVAPVRMWRLDGGSGRLSYLMRLMCCGFLSDGPGCCLQLINGLSLIWRVHRSSQTKITNPFHLIRIKTSAVIGV